MCPHMDLIRHFRDKIRRHNFDAGFPSKNLENPKLSRYVFALSTKWNLVVADLCKFLGLVCEEHNLLVAKSF